MNEKMKQQYEAQHEKCSAILDSYLKEREKLLAMQEEIQRNINSEKTKMQRRSRQLNASKTDKDV
jgi:alpha-D-ribose 1-methylphosphonate 5-triphosphate synthase subunit PhnG